MRKELHCSRHCTNQRSLDEAVVWMDMCGHLSVSQPRRNAAPGNDRKQKQHCWLFSPAKNIKQQQSKIFIRPAARVTGRNRHMWVSVLLASCDFSTSPDVLHQVPSDIRALKAHLQLQPMLMGWKTERLVWDSVFRNFLVFDSFISYKARIQIYFQI